MSDDDSSPSHTAFWPVAIFLGTLAFTSIFQLVEIISHCSAVNEQYAQAAPNIPKAQAARDRLIALVKDLANQTDPNAGLVLQQAQRTGILHERATTPADTNAAPAAPTP